MPQQRKIIEAGEVFDRGAYTYATGHRSIERFGILPIGPAIFRLEWTSSTEDRWRIEFDGSDVVSSVSNVEETRDDR